MLGALAAALGLGGGCSSDTCSGVPVAAGCAGLNALRRRTRENPWFAVATGVIHGGEVEYARAQAVVEAVADLGAEAFVDVADARRHLRGAQLGDSEVAARLSAAARCYVAHAPRGRVDLDALTACVRRERTGIGPKAGALMREYLGDDDAVAVDRHVMDFVCRQTGRNCKMKVAPEVRDALRRRGGVIIGAPDRKGAPARLFYVARDGTERALDVVPWRRGGPIGPREFRLGEATIRSLAHACGVSAAAFQVAVWLQSACLVKGRGVGFSMPLTRGAAFPCAAVVGQRALFGAVDAAREVRVVEVSPSVFVTV